jgi:hypothetical protein
MNTLFKINKEGIPNNILNIKIKGKCPRGRPRGKMSYRKKEKHGNKLRR